MSERKNIDKLFQEKFKDFEVEPSEIVWQNIEEKLKEKKKRRVIPFWWKLSGVAAIITLGLGLTYPIWSTKSLTENPIVLENQSESNSNINSEKNTILPSKTDVIVSSEKLNTNSNEAIVLNEVPNESVSNTAENLISNSEKKYEKKNPVTTSISNSWNKINKNESQIALKTTEKATEEIQKRNSNPDLIHKTENKIVQSDNLNENEVSTEKSKSVVVSKNSNEVISTLKVETENKNNIKKIDSTAIATVVSNAMEELLNEKENNLVTKEPQLNRWQITPNFAPIYFGSTSNGSPIDSTFAGNSKDYNSNLGYGLGVSYAVNKKIKIRTGINNVSLSYNTNDVAFYMGLENNSLNNINLASESQNMVILNKTPEPITTPINGIAVADFQTETFQGNLDQKMGYLEIPLELTYAVIDKKFGVNIIGGISTLFLNENEILMISSNSISNVGEANNLSKIHYSTNVGLGLKYNFLKDFQANFEPMFKYQINTFTKDTGGFKPYFFGFYTGVSYNF